MGFVIYNTKTRKKEEFKPIGEVVNLYTCGPTVYNFAHIGNFRAYMFEDLLRRYLKFKGFMVNQIMNITDIDDKTIKNSKEQGISLKDFTEKYTQSFFEDIEVLNIEKAEKYPKATDHIKEMIEMIQILLDKGIAYKSEDGSIYYSVKKFPNYGDLSKIKVEELKEGARVSHDEYEKDTASDFALWKAYTEEDGDVFWESPFGKGRPGWHIECSAMSTKYLGNHFDIHTGGVDNMFPHHENEIAQSEACTGEKFVNFWMHCEHLLVNGKKMSKSLGNFYTLRDLIKLGHSSKAIRYALISTHYRKQLDFTEHLIQSSDQAIKRIQELIDNLQDVKGIDKPIAGLIDDARNEFIKFMDDDLDIANAMIVIFDFVKKINTETSKGNISAESGLKVIEFLKEVDSVIGVLSFEQEKIPSEITMLAEQRIQARKDKNWELSDKLRDQINEKGYRIDDTDDGFKIKKL